MHQPADRSIAIAGSREDLTGELAKQSVVGIREVALVVAYDTLSLMLPGSGE